MSRNENTWLEILSENDFSYQTKYYNKVLAYVRQNYMKIYTNRQFLSLKLKLLYQILDSDDLNVENEEIVFESVRRWLNFNGFLDEMQIKPLLKVVRYSLLPIEYLFDEVEPFIYSLKECRDIFLNVLRSHYLDDRKIDAPIRKYQKISMESNVNNCKITPKSSEPSKKLLSISTDRLKNADLIEIYDGDLKKWKKLKDPFLHRMNFSVVLVEGKAMLIGGIGHFRNRRSRSKVEPLTMVQFLDLTNCSLSMEAHLEEARQHAAAVTIGKGKLSYVFVLGGRGMENDLDSVERWDPLSRVWTTTSHMLQKRTGPAAIFFNDDIYVLGGKTDYIYTNTMEVYNFEIKKWEMKAPMKEARAHFCVAVFKDFLYAVAGSERYNSHLNSVERYNPDDDSWSTIANITMTGHVGISSLGNKLICAGGKHSKQVLEYNSENNTWSKLKVLRVEREGFLLEIPEEMKGLKFNWDNDILSSEKILMLGNQESSTNCSLEVYDIDNNHWNRLNDLDIGKINYAVAHNYRNLFIIGGVFPDGNTQTNTNESVNLKKGTVSPIAPLRYPRENTAAVIIEESKITFIFTFGGTKDDQYMNSVERWNSLTQKWDMMAPMTTARSGHGAVATRNEIYVVGGKTGPNYTKSVEGYDFYKDEWVKKAPLNNRNAYFGIAALNDIIFVAGGNLDSATPVSTVERYDPFQNYWTTIANISSSGTVGLISLGDKLICAGGNSSDLVEEYDENEKQWRKLKSLSIQTSGYLVGLGVNVEVHSGIWDVKKRPSYRLVFLGDGNFSFGKPIELFDLKNNKWTLLKNLPISREFFNANVISDKLLIMGGMEGRNVSKTVEAIDFSSGKLISISPLKTARIEASSVVVHERTKDTLYIFGGRDEDLNDLSSVEIWDPLTDEWTDGIPMPTARYGHGSTFLHGKIYVVGGETISSVLYSMDVFDIKQGIWREKAPTNHIHRNFGITTYGNYIYVAGGTPSSIVERYDPRTDSWTTIASVLASDQVTLCVSGNRLICAGGDIKDVETYDEDKNKWNKLKSKNRTAPRGYLLELPQGADLEKW